MPLLNHATRSHTMLHQVTAMPLHATPSHSHGITWHNHVTASYAKPHHYKVHQSTATPLHGTPSHAMTQLCHCTVRHTTSCLDTPLHCTPWTHHCTAWHAKPPCLDTPQPRRELTPWHNMLRHRITSPLHRLPSHAKLWHNLRRAMPLHATPRHATTHYATAQPCNWVHQATAQHAQPHPCLYTVRQAKPWRNTHIC